MSENVQKKLKARVIHKHKTESAWRMDVYDSDGNLRENAFVPESGELIIFDPEKDGDVKRFKFGDGRLNVIELPFNGITEDQEAKLENISLNNDGIAVNSLIVGSDDNIHIDDSGIYTNSPDVAITFGKEEEGMLIISGDGNIIQTAGTFLSSNEIYVGSNDDVVLDATGITAPEFRTSDPGEGVTINASGITIAGEDVGATINGKNIATEAFVLDNVPVTSDENGTLVIENGIATEGCTAYAKAGSAIGIKTYSGSKAFTIWGLGEGSTVDADEGTYLVDGIEVFDENGEKIYGVEVGDDYSCHVCYENATTSNSRQRSFYGKVTAIEETEQVSPAGRPLYAITVSPFFGLPADSTFRPFITNEDGTISDEETEYLDAYGVDQERNTFRIPSKPLLGDRILGAYAYATGYYSSANTRGGFTSGVSNIADGNYGAAIGFNNKAAYAAIATGNGTSAIGIKSFTQGANT